jgi:hypothetical protein
MSAEGCQPFQELLSDLADGELEGLEAASVEGHVAECASCRVELQLLRGVVLNLTAIPEEDVPPVLMSRVMDTVRQPSLADRIIALLAAPFSPAFLRVSLSAAALVTMAFLGRALLNTEARAPSGGEAFACVPLWWNGELMVNDALHAPSESGRVGLRPGDSFRTADRVQVAMTVREAQVEVRPHSAVIVQRNGLSLLDGALSVHVDENHAAIPESQAMRIVTPKAVIVHIGTVFKVSVSNGVTRTEVIQGRVRVYPSSGATQDLTAGQVAQVDDRGVLTSPAEDSAIPVKPPRTGPEEIRSITQSLPGGPARQ